MTMDNGNYYFIKTPNNLMSVVSLWSSRGSSLDPEGKEGLSHYFEHLFFNKTRALPNKIAVLKHIDGMGIFFNAFTKKNFVYYYMIQEIKTQEKAYELLLQGLKDFDISENDIVRERDIIINEQNQFIDNPKLYIWNLADRGLWPRSPLADFGLGNKSSVYSIHREDVLRYKEILFSPENVGFLTISSSSISQQMEKTLLKFTSTHTSTNQPSEETMNFKDSNKLLCEYRPTETIFLTMSFPLPKMSRIIKDKIYLDYIRNYLASGWSSKLIERLRLEKNYIYWAFGGVECFNEAGYFRISFSTLKKNIRDTLDIVIEEIQKLQQEHLGDEELLHHKNAMKAHILKNYMELENMLWWYGWNIFTAHRQHTVGDYFEAIDKISSNDIQSISQKYLSIDRMHIAAIGNVLESDFRY